MAIIGISLQWYDAFFLSVLAICASIVAINWEKYDICAYPLHLWTVVDYTAVFIFRLLMFVDNALAAGMGPNTGEQQRHVRFCGRVIVLAILGVLLYPFLFAWTIIGTLWFAPAKSCLPGHAQKMCFVIWLIFSYCGLLGIKLICMSKWFVRRQAHHLRAQQGNPISEIGVLVDLIRVPDGASDEAGPEMGGMARHRPGRLSLTQAQRQVVETHIQELPKIELTVPSAQFISKSYRLGMRYAVSLARITSM